MKKSFFLAIALFGSLWLYYQVDVKNVTHLPCAFCRQDVIENQVFYRGEQVWGLLTYKPATPGHVLIVPKRHVERFENLTADELIEMKELIQKIDAAERRLFGNTGYLLLQKNGSEAGQSVPHVHIHYLPRSKKESHLLFAARFFLSPWLNSLSPIAMEEAIRALQSEIDRTPHLQRQDPLQAVI